MSGTYPSGPIDILLVEDNAGDVRLTTEALKEAKIANKLHVVRDGVEALNFLRREGPHAGAPRPDLMLLDLNLPRKNGQEAWPRSRTTLGCNASQLSS